MQVALLREAMSTVENDEATASEIDEIVRSGFGPKFAEIGVFGSVSHSDMSDLFSELNNDRVLPSLFLDKINSGDLGVKTGKGFYEWTPESVEIWRANMANSLLHMD